MRRTGRRISALDCDTAGGGAGSYVAALVHCERCIDGGTTGAECFYAETYDCRATVDTSTYCSASVCRGTCPSGAHCFDGVFMSDTHTNPSACGATDPANQTGVLYCRS